MSYFRHVIEDRSEITYAKIYEHAKKHLKLKTNDTMAKRVKRKIMTELEGITRMTIEEYGTI